MLRFSLILVGFLPLALGFSSGAPGSACEDLIPQHGVAAQIGASPFGITPPGDTVQKGSIVELTLHGAPGTSFMGFIVRAFEGTDGSAGVFQASPNVQPRTCVGTKNGATHTSPSLKQQVKLSWTAPDYPTIVEFKSTVVVDFSTIYLNKPVFVKVV
ncbi:unnamed protein product [Meganyctiphanes norvegica]|uniref:Reelin domain-containing protein n=1 Tax=Meganyctiphanes norvegica TaxID=48144 RepID=A0AAV2RHY5_MEGNR